MASGLPVALPNAYPSRRGWLIAFGIVAILIGCFFVLMILFLALALLGPVHTQPMPGGFSPAVMLAFLGLQYALFAAVFIIAGIGSIRCRNWARIMMLVVSGFWLAIGLLTTAVMAFVFPVVMRQQPHPLPPAVEHVVLAVMFIFLVGGLVVLPTTFLIFYCLKSVRATCLASRGGALQGAAVDESATAHTPVPVFILGVWETFTALSVFFCLFFRVTVFFGIVLHGVIAVAYFLTYSLLSAFAAWLIFRRDILGWQIAIAKTGIMALSALITVLHPPDMVRVFREMGLNEQTVRIYDQFPQLLPAIWGFTLVFMCGLIAFIIFTRRYFRSEQAA